jgi:hypothetical protein
VAYSKGMATGLPARVVILCAVVATAMGSALAQVPPTLPADRPPVTSPTAAPPNAAPGAQPGIAQATGRREVAVIDLSGGDEEQKLADALYNALVNHIDLRPLTNPNLVGALRGTLVDEEQRYIEEARQAKKATDDALGQLDHKDAELAANRGLEALHNVRPTSDVLGLYAELAFAAGQAALKQRKPNDASLAFGLSYRLDPAKRPDPARYEPDIIEAYQLAVTKLPVPAKLEVKGTGTVWIDGVDRGPPGVLEVNQGRHLVQLVGPERETRGKQVTSPVDTVVEIDAAPATVERKVERMRLELARARDAAARAGAVKKLAQLLGVGDAVLIEKDATGVIRVQTWRDREPGFSAWVEHRQESPVDLLFPLAPPRQIEPPKGRDPEVRPFTPPIVDTPLLRKRWFQGAVVLGVLAAAVGIYAWASDTGTIDWQMGDVKPEGE